MMGEQQRGGKGASWRALGAMIPADHILRRIDGLIDLGELRHALAPHYSRRGRPSIAPELLIRMSLIARLYGLTSERRLCEEVRFNLAYRWFCRLPLDAPVPHHSTFSKNRHGRFRDAGIFRILFEQTVRRCADAGLIAHKDAAIDASFVAADASWQRKMRDADMAAPRLPRPVCEWLADQANAPPQEHGVPARADDRFGYRPKRVAADTAYGSAAFLAFVTDRGTIPHIPVLERSEQTKGKFPREAFRYEREQGRYVCPAGKILPFRGADRRAGFLRYSASPADCRACYLKRKCTAGSNRSVTHSEHENVRELVRGEMQTPLFKRSMRLRRGVERVFADAKGKRGLTRLHLRGLRGAEEEFLLGAAIANLVLLARPDARPARTRRPPPVPERIDHMARISRGRFEQSYYATIF
ncbi:MAG: transposase [Sphingomonas pseudosanguinis]|uniref:transposase n=1 Tax=Sphingomonas pseudosanguinis TaxID=413712 RepID=UPI003919766C